MPEGVSLGLSQSLTAVSLHLGYPLARALPSSHFFLNAKMIQMLTTTKSRPSGFQHIPWSQQGAISVCVPTRAVLREKGLMVAVSEPWAGEGEGIVLNLQHPDDLLLESSLLRIHMGGWKGQGQPCFTPRVLPTHLLCLPSREHVQLPSSCV